MNKEKILTVYLQFNWEKYGEKEKQDLGDNTYE